MDAAVLATSIDDLELSVRSSELLRGLGARTVGDVLALPAIAMPEDWPVKMARLVAMELGEIFEQLGVTYEGQLIVPPAGEVTLHATGSVAERWATIEGWLEENQPRALEGFRAATTREAIVAAESTLGVSLPEDYKAFLQIHDGQEELESWVGLGALLSIAEVVAAHARLGRMELSAAGESDPIEAEHADEGVRSVSYVSGWIPISRSARGRDYLCIDLDPAPGGVRGQIVEYIVDDKRRRRVADSFADLMSLYLTQAQTGEIDFDRFDDDDDVDEDE